MKRIAVSLIAFLWASAAFAGASTVTVLDSTGTTKTFDVVTDGSGHYVAFGTVCDGTAAAQCAAVKAASTSALTTDPALVVQMSPQSPMFGTAGTASAEVLSVQGIASGTNLPVSQATASSLNATVVGTGTFATQSVVTQGTASNLNAAVVGVGTAGSASGGVLTVQGAASMTPIGTSPNPYPLTAVPITASATGTTAATTATLTAVSGHTTYICGFSIRANATGAATGNATITGTITGTLNFTQWTAPLASGLGVTENTFSPCVPASAVTTSIAVISAAPGSGGVVSVSAWGYSI